MKRKRESNQLDEENRALKRIHESNENNFLTSKTPIFKVNLKKDPFTCSLPNIDLSKEKKDLAKFQSKLWKIPEDIDYETAPDRYVYY